MLPKMNVKAKEA